MPTNISALLILVLAILPGTFGNYMYKILIGVDWRERDFWSVLRLISFSVFGVGLYIFVAKFFNCPAPIYLIPSTYKTFSGNLDEFIAIFVPYFGHLLGSFVVGVLSGLGAILLAKIFARTPYPSAWDDFLRACIPKHWVVVSLHNGESYAGKLKTADLGVEVSERDLVIEEPCVYDEGQSNYIALNYQYIFIPSNYWYSVGVIHDPAIDKKRLVDVDTPLFETKKGDKKDG